MISLNQITITEQQVTKGGLMLCTDVRPVKEFKDGKPTDKIIGYNYTIVCPSNKFVQFQLKVENQAVTVEELEAKGGSVKIKVKGFEGRFFTNSNKDVLFTAKASGIEVVP